MGPRRESNPRPADYKPAALPLRHWGGNGRVISARQGHSTVAFTLDTYAHLLPDADAEAAEKLAAMLGHGRAALAAG